MSGFDRVLKNDNQDFYKEDWEDQVQNIEDAVGDRQDDVMPDFSGSVKNPAAGVVFGMDVSYSPVSGLVTVSAGVVFNRGCRGEFATAQTVAASSLSVGNYLVARIGYTDGTPRTNPVSGADENTRRVYSCTLVVTDIPTDADVILARVAAFDVLEPLFGVQASFSFTAGVNTLTIVPKTGVVPAVDVRGAAGNKYFVRFKALPNVATFADKLSDPSGLGFQYLFVYLEADSTGTVVATLNDIVNAINATTLWFAASVTGSGSYVPTLLPASYPDYTAMSGGTDYRTYYEVFTGSKALSQVSRFNPSDPFSKHISQKGSGVPTAGNPHGTTLEDIGASELSTESHILREHYSGSSLPRSVSAGFLATSFSASNTVDVAKSASSADVALIAGKICGVDSNFSLTAPSALMELYEFYVNVAGRINYRVVSSFDVDAPPVGYASIINGIRPVLSIIDKDPLLTGSKVVYLTIANVPGVGDVSTAKLGSTGTEVDVTAVGFYILKDPSDNTWIEVYRENEVLAVGSYANTVTFTAYNPSSELPVSMVPWCGPSQDWGYSGGDQFFTDKRTYGSLDLSHDKSLDVADLIPPEFTAKAFAGFTVFSAGSLVLTVNPFNIRYRGHTYQKSLQSTFTLPDSVESYLCASFDVRNGMTLSVVAASAYAHVQDRVVIARMVANATEITAVYEAYMPGSFKQSDLSYVFNVETADEMYLALTSLSAVPSFYKPVINVRASFTFDLALYTLPSGISIDRVTIRTNGFTVAWIDSAATGNTIAVSGEFNLVDCLFTHTVKVFSCAGVTIDQSVISESGVLSFLESTGAVNIYRSTVSAVDLKGAYELLNVVNSKFTVGFFLYNSGRLNFDGVEYTSNVSASLVKFQEEPASFTDISIRNGKFSGTNYGIVTTENSGFLTWFGLRIESSIINYSSVVSSSFNANIIEVSVYDSKIKNFGFSAAPGSVLSVYGNSVLEGEVVFTATSALSFESSVYVNILGGRIVGVLNISSRTQLQIDSAVRTSSNPIFKTSVSALINVVGNVPLSTFLDLTWGAKTPFIHYNGSLFRHIPFNVATEDDLDDFIYFASILRHADYGFILQSYGGSPYKGASSKNLVIKNVTGYGGITLPTGFTWGSIQLFNCSCQLIFYGTHTVEKQSSTAAGVDIDRCSNVTFETLTSFYAYNVSDITHRLLRVVNSNVVVETELNFDGDYGSGNPSTYLIDISSNSIVTIDDATLRCTDGSANITARAYIYTDPTSHLFLTGSPLFYFNGYNIDHETVHYRHQNSAWELKYNNAALVAESILSNIVSVEAELEVNWGGYRSGNCNIHNVTGSGIITFNHLQTFNDKYLAFLDVTPSIIVEDLFIDHRLAGTSPISLIRVRYAKFDEIYIADDTDANSPVFDCRASKVVFSSIEYASTCTNFNALYNFSFSENSDVQITLIDTSYINVAVFPAAKVTASRVHVKEVTPYSGKDIRFVLAEAAHVVHKNGTGDYIVSTDALAIIPQ